MQVLYILYTVTKHK